MKIILTFFLVFFSLFVFAQKKKTYMPIWTFHQKNINIYGLSVGLWDYSTKNKNTTSNGIRLALIGEGILAPLAPTGPSTMEDSVFQKLRNGDFCQKINGINLSGTGNLGDYIINGISLGFVGQANSKVNGISGGIFVNYVGIHNGIQLAMINDTYKMSGIQIGIFNKSKHTKGVQIGIWNVNEHRQFPIFNWGFR